MVLRVIQFIAGALLAGGGGYLAFTHRSGFAEGVFPPGAGGLPLLLLAGLFGLTTGLVFLVSALHPRPNQRRLQAAKAEREDAALQQAEAYYSERSRAADRDWRSADITPPPIPAAPVAPPPIAPIVPESTRAFTAPPIATAPVTAPPAPLFPADATLSKIPRVAELAPVTVRPAPVVAPVTFANGDLLGAIRAAILSGQLDEAEKLLNAARETAAGLELAQLTALAGDHALAKGQQTHARWLWRLAMKRFGENEAADSPAAHAVAESLRTAG